jgi:hypothetical protein
MRDSIGSKVSNMHQLNIWNRWAKSFAVFIVLGVSPYSVSTVLAAAPTLTHLYPAGGQRGTTVQVTATGTFDWPVKVWSPGLQIMTGKEKGKLDISIPADLATDRVWIRFYNDEGASAAVPFLIGNLRELTEKEPNNTAVEAQEIADSRGIVNGVLQAAGDVDGFSVQLEEGQTLVAALAANSRLGSPMDAILQLATPSGFVVAENHDAIGLDPRLTYTATQSATYIVRVFAFPSAPNSSIRYAGAANYIYRLTMTTGPYIANAGPLSTSQSELGDVAVFGWNLPANARLPVKPLGDAHLVAQREFEPLSSGVSPDVQLGFVFSPTYAGSARVRLTPHPVIMNSADGDEEPPITLTAPTSISGRLSKDREVDHYLVTLRKSQRVVLIAECDRGELPVIPLMRLTHPDGTPAAATKDPGTRKETTLTFVAKMDGDHVLEVFDRYGHGSERHFYRITVVEERTDFELTIGSDTLVLEKDKPLEIEISVNRKIRGGVKLGPITVSVDGLPKGIVATSAVSQPTGDTAKKVKISIAKSSTNYSGPIRVVGTTSEPTKLRRTARTPPKLGNSFDTIWFTAQ